MSIRWARGSQKVGLMDAAERAVLLIADCILETAGDGGAFTCLVHGAECSMLLTVDAPTDPPTEQVK